MGSARYWRLQGLEAHAAGDLELTEIALFSGASRVDVSATLTCSHAPIAGALSDLMDGGTSAACRFAAADVRSAGFFLQWDFGVAAAVDGIKLGASSSPARFLSAAQMLRSDSHGSWTVVGGFSGVVYPGAGALTDMEPGGGAAYTAWNPEDKGLNCVLSNNNLTGSGTVVHGAVRSLFSASSGKWYWEITLDNSAYPAGVGVGTAAALMSNYAGGDAGGWAWYADIGKSYAAAVPSSYGAVGGYQGAVVGVALDMDSGTISLSKNGIWMGVMFSGLTGGMYALCSGNANVVSGWTANFGESPFVHSPPAGFVPGFGVLPLQGPISVPRTPRGSYTRTRVGASATVEPHALLTAPALDVARDIEFGGRCAVVGVTKIKGSPNAPFRCRVRLLRDRDALLVREVWSDAITGAFVFEGVSEDYTYTAYAQDHTGNFRAVITDRITAEVIA